MIDVLLATRGTYTRTLTLSSTAISNCEDVSEVNSDIVAHMYDIWVGSNDLLVYTDWDSKSVNVLSLSTGTLLQPLATGLMRPSQLLFVGTDTTSGTSYVFKLRSVQFYRRYRGQNCAEYRYFTTLEILLSRAACYFFLRYCVRYIKCVLALHFAAVS